MGNNGTNGSNGNHEKENQEPLTLAQIKQYRQLAAKHPSNVASKIIIRILNELRRQKLRNDQLEAAVFGSKGRNAPLNGDNLMTFGEHKGSLLRDVPNDYFGWWLSKQNLQALEIDAEHKPYPARGAALQKLRLYDYVRARLNGNAI
jgi:hypothetical protein